MSKIEIILVILMVCSVFAYLYINVISVPVFEARVYEFKGENMTVLEEETSNTISNDISVNTNLNSTIRGDNSSG